MALQNINGGPGALPVPLLGLEEIDPITNLDKGNSKTVALPVPGSDYQDSVDVRQGQTPESYQRILGDNYHPEFSERTIQSRLHENQGVGGMFVNALAQTVTGTVGQAIEGIGYLTDLRGPSMFIDDGEKSFGEYFIAAGKALIEEGEEIAPIYSDPNGLKFDPTSWAWWMKNAPSIASTLSLVYTSAAPIKALGAVGKLLGLAGKAGVVAEQAMSIVGQSLLSRRMEGMMEARGTYEDIYNKSIKAGMKPEDASKKAAIGATQTYKADYAMLLMDIAQYSLLHKKMFKPNAEGTTPALGKLLGYDKGKTLIPEVKRYSFEAVTEGFEEGFQWMSSEEGKYAAEKAFNPSLKGDFSERVGGYLRDGDMWTNSFFGALGGLSMSYAGDALGKIGGDHQVNEVKSWGVGFRAAYEKMKMGQSMGDDHMVTEAQHELKAMLGVRGASKGMLDQTIDFYSKIANGKFTEEELNKLNIDPETIQDLRGTDIEQSKKDIRAAGMRYIENLKEVYKPNTKLNKALNKLYANRTKDMKGISLENYGRSFASLIARTELQLDKLSGIKSEVERESKSAEDRIVNFKDLTPNKQSQFLIQASIDALNKQRKSVERNLSNKDIDDTYKEDINNVLAVIDKKIASYDKMLSDLNKTYTPDDKKNDADVKIESPAIAEFYDKQSILARLTASIESYQSALERYRNGEISSEEARDEYDSKLEEDEKDVKDVTPEEDDIVSWEDNVGAVHMGVVTASDGLDDTILNVQEIDEEYRDVGKPVPKNKVDLELINKIGDLEIERINVETLSSDDETSDDLYREELANSGVNKALSDLSNSLSTSHIDTTKPAQIEIRDRALDSYASDPKNKFEGAVATFTIDWANKFWDEGGVERRKFKLKAQSGKITLKEIEKLLEVQEKNIDNFGVELVDKLPIKVSIKVGDQTFDKELYLHDSDFWNVRMPDNLPMDPFAFEMEQREITRTIRTQIITELTKGNIVTTKDITKLNGFFNIVKTSGNIHQRLGVDSGSLKLWVGVPGPGNIVLIQSSPTDIRLFGKPSNPGGIYITTTKTASGDEALLRVNPSKLSTEHAEILWDSIMLLYSKGGGRKSKLKDERVKGLTVQEVIDLLVLFGQRSTDPKHPNNINKNTQQNKALYSLREEGGRMLYFGDQKVPVYENRPAEIEANKLAFIEWATKNKNYRVPISNKKLSLDLNKQFKKKFTLGSFVNDGKKSYAATMMDTVIGSDAQGPIYMISTNVDRVIDPSTGKYIESITHAPVIDINTRSLIVNNPKVITREEAPIKPPVTPVAPVEPIKPITVKKQQVSIDSLKQLPTGTNFYYVKIDGKKVVFAELRIASNGKKILELTNGFEDNVKIKNYKSLTIVKSNQQFFNELFDYIMSGSTEINYELPISKAEKEDLNKPIKPDEDIDTGDEDLDDLKPLGSGTGKLSYKVKPGTKIISQQEIDWLYKKLGKQKVNRVPKLIKLAGQKGRFYFGLFRADAISIYEASPADVLYHEAFHRVSLGYLSESDRKRVYDEARRRYELQGASDEAVEEHLADEFMGYKSNGGKPGRRGVLEFIVDLYDFIVTFFTGKTRLRGDDIDKLFASIERGKFRYSKISEDNLKALHGKSVGYEIGGKDVPTIHDVIEMDSIVRGLATVLIEVNHIEDLNDVGNLDFSKLIRYINHIPDPDNKEDQPGLLQRFKTIKKKKELKLTDSKITQEVRDKLMADISEVSHLIDLYDSIINKDYLPIFIARIEAALRSYNIVKKEVDVEEGDIDQYLSNINKAMYEFNTKDTVLASIKFLIATLPASDKINKTTFTIDHVNFSDAWSRLLFDLWDKDSIEEIFDKLDSKSDIYYYKVLAEKLRKGDDILRNQFKVAMNKHKQMFVNFLFKEGNVDGKDIFTFKMLSTDVFSAASREIMFWNQAIYETNIIDKTGTPKINVDKIDSLIARYSEILKSFSAVYTQTGKAITNEQFDYYLNSLLPLFFELGIEVDRPTVARVIEKIAVENKITKNEALNFFILNDGLYIFKRIKSETTNKTKPIAKLFNDERTIRRLAETKFEVHPDLMNDSILGPSGNQYFTYTQNTYLSDIIRKFSKDKDAVLRKITKIYSKHSDFLAQMLDDDVRKNVKLLTLSAFIQEDIGDSGRDYLSINRMEDYLIKLYAFERGLISLPTLADKRSYFFLQGLKPIEFDLEFDDNGNFTIPENVIDLIYGYALDEKERIEKATEQINDYKNETDPVIKKEKGDKLIDKYHYVRRGDDLIDTNSANATRYHLFPSFNTKENFNFEKDAREEIKNILLTRFNDELKFAANRGIITGRLLENGTFVPDYNVKIDTDLLERNKEDFGTETKALQNIIARYMVRTIQSGVEFSKLVVGDPAFKSSDKVKGTVDEMYIKRLTGCLSTGDVTNNESIEYGIIGKNYTASTLYTQRLSLDKEIYDDIFDAHLADAVKSFSKRKGYEDLPNKSRKQQLEILKEDFNYNIKDMLKSFKNIDSTDGQAWISPQMFKALCLSIGDWSPKKEEAFKLLQSDKELSKEEYIKSLGVVLQPLKIVSFGLMEDGELEVPLFDKMAMSTIFRQMGKFGNKKGVRIELMELLDRMEAVGKYKGLTPIDMVKSIEVAKTGGKGGFNFYSNEELTEVSDFSNIPFFEQPFALSRRQLVTDPHDQSRTKAGTQMIKMGMADILKDEDIYSNPIISELANKSTVTGEELINTILRCTGALSDKGLERLKNRLGYVNGKINKELLVKMLKKDNIKAATADLIVDAFKMDSDGQMYLELDSFPNRKYIFSRIISMFAKEIIDIKLPGNQFIQVSNMGVRVNKDKELKWTKIKNGAVTEMECYVSINLFKHVIPNYDTLSFEDKREFILRNADSIMGYRIPTEGQKSVFILKIKDVYPETIGDVITLPAAFTSLTGSDFDIDKVYVVRYNYKIIDNQLHKVQFYNSINDVWEKELKIKYYWVYKFLDKLDTIVNNDFSKVGGTDGAVRLIENLGKIIDDEIMDPEEKESMLYTLRVNLYAEEFDTEEYNRFKELIGGSIENNKDKFYNKYKDETNPYKFNTKAAIENLLIDAHRSVYTNIAHVRQTTTPLGASVSVLKDLAEHIHKFDEVGISSKDLVLYTPSKQSNIKFEYTGGKDGIGPFALNNVHHILAQIAGLKMRDESFGILNEDENGHIDLSQIYGKDGFSIMTWLESLIEIHVDVAKDPFVTWLNLNSATYDVTALLIRGGLGADTFRFISQPIIKEFADLMLDSSSDSKISRFEDRDAVIKYLKKTWEDRLEAAMKVKDAPAVKELSTQELMESKEMMSNIELQHSNKNDVNFISHQLQYLNTFLSLSISGKKLNELVQASQLDTKKFGNSITSVIAFKNRINNIRKANDFINIDKMFASEDSGQPSFLGPYLTNFLGFTLGSMSDLTIYSTPVFNMLLSNIIRDTKVEFAGDKKLIDVVSDELMAAIFAKFFNDPDFIGLNPDKFKRLMDYITDIVTQIKYRKDPAYKNLLENNSLIKFLDKHAVEDLETILPFETFLAIPNKNLSDKFSTDSLIYAWRDLFDSKDEKIQNLARLLMYYSFITSGFRNRLFSFHNYIPPSKMKNLYVKDPKNADNIIPMSFNEFIKVQRDLLSDESNYAMFAYLEDEVVINNWANSKIVPRISANDRVATSNFIGDVEQGTLTAVITKKWNNKLGINALQQPVFTKYLTTSVRSGQRYKTYLLKYIGYTTVEIKGKQVFNAVYKVIAKRSYEKGGVVFKEYLFDSSIIPSNNVPFIPDGDELATLKGKANLDKNKMFENFQPVEDLQLVDKNNVSKRNILSGLIVEDSMMGLDIDDINFTKGKLKKGEEISSYSNNLGFALTNPTHTSPLGYEWSREWTTGQKAWREYLSNGIIYNDVKYRDVEDAYQKNKVGKSNSEKKQLMIDLMVIKLETYTKLVDGIDTKGGVAYLADSTHTPTKTANDWESSGQNLFIKLLTQAYIVVKKRQENFDIKNEEDDVLLTPNDYTNHSGGADGADTTFELIGKSRLFKKHNQYWYQEKTPTGNNEISELDAQEGQAKSTIAARQMGRIEQTHQIRDVKIIRDWAQVKYSEAIYAVSKIIKKGEALPYDKIALIDQVKGGTGYAVQMGINEGRQVYVFDQEVRQWYKYNHTTKEFEVTSDPILTKNYAGIGTRTLNEYGRKAIAKLFDDTLKYIGSIKASFPVKESREAPVQGDLFGNVDEQSPIDNDNTTDEYPFTDDDESTIFSTQNKVVYELVAKLNITDWAAVTKEQWAQLREAYKHCE